MILNSHHCFRNIVFPFCLIIVLTICSEFVHSKSTKRVTSVTDPIAEQLLDIEKQFQNSDLSIHDAKTKITQKLKKNQNDPPITFDDVVELPCKKSVNGSEEACNDYCVRTKETGEGVCSRDGISCLCRTSGELIFRAKLYVPKTYKRHLKISSRPKLVRKDIGKFDCNNSPEAKSICQVYCEIRNSTNSACSDDGRSCQCFSYILGKRNKKVRDSRGLSLGLQEEEEIVIPNSSAITFPELSGRLGLHGKSRYRPAIRPGMGMMGGAGISPQHLARCTPFSCLRNCPPDCDSLCTKDLQCMCSCREDVVYYDYYYDPYMG